MSDESLTAAAERLNRACAKVEAVMARLKTRAESARTEAAAAGDYDADRARLADALDAAQAREQALAEAAAEASEALGAAIGELRAAAQAAEAEGA
ncbi:MAG: DUF4164 family protein [Maricaulaceae bacterium]|nr:DUF4164 family protein [Maricaulaceae bacterium]